MDAVIVTAEGGSVVGVVIVPKGDPPLNNYGVFRADCIENLRVTWRDDQPHSLPRRPLLELAFERARIYDFTNYWHSEAVKDYGYKVEITLSHPPGRVLGC